MLNKLNNNNKNIMNKKKKVNNIKELISFLKLI